MKKYGPTHLEPEIGLQIKDVSDTRVFLGLLKGTTKDRTAVEVVGPEAGLAEASSEYVVSNLTAYS